VHLGAFGLIWVHFSIRVHLGAFGLIWVHFSIRVHLGALCNLGALNELA